jgi:hypothetical protein
MVRCAGAGDAGGRSVVDDSICSRFLLVIFLFSESLVIFRVGELRTGLPSAVYKAECEGTTDKDRTT